MTKAVIIDDEKMARTVLSVLLEDCFDDIEVVASCHDLQSGIDAIKTHLPDVVFLDIEMPEQSGLELLNHFEDHEVNFSIIFTTAYSQYALQAFKLSAIDYLLKPIELSELKLAIERHMKNRRKAKLSLLKNNLDPELPQKIAIAATNAVRFVEVEKILYLKAEGSYTHLYMNDDSSMLVSKRLKHYGDLLEYNKFFYRCHKSYIINLAMVTEYVKSDGGYLVLANKHHVSVSSEKVVDLLDMLMFQKR